MRFGIIVVLCLACAALAQRTRPPAGPRVLLLPVAIEIDAGPDRKELLEILARASLLVELQQRGFTIISDAMRMSSEREMGISLSETRYWTPKELQVLASRWDARFIIGVRLTQTTMEFESITAADGSVAPGAKLILETHVIASVYDASARKLAAEGEKGAGKKEEAVHGPVEDPPAAMLTATFRSAFQAALAVWLKEYPLKRG